MGSFVLGLLFLGGIWLFFSMRSQYRAQLAWSTAPLANEWLQTRDIDPESARFSTYHDAALTERANAHVIVGVGAKTDGQEAGFVVEVVPGGEAVGVELTPSGLATHHGRCAHKAKMEGQSLMAVMEGLSSGGTRTTAAVAATDRGSPKAKPVLRRTQPSKQSHDSRDRSPVLSTVDSARRATPQSEPMRLRKIYLTEVEDNFIRNYAFEPRKDHNTACTNVFLAAIDQAGDDGLSIDEGTLRAATAYYCILLHYSLNAQARRVLEGMDAHIETAAQQGNLPKGRIDEAAEAIVEAQRIAQIQTLS